MVGFLVGWEVAQKSKWEQEKQKCSEMKQKTKDLLGASVGSWVGLEVVGDFVGGFDGSKVGLEVAKEICFTWTLLFGIFKMPLAYWPLSWHVWKSFESQLVSWTKFNLSNTKFKHFYLHLNL